jgi:hypothetical protein
MLAAIAGGVVTACARPALGQHVYTNGAGTNLWCTPENWEPPTIPSGSAIIGPEVTQRVGFSSNCTPTFSTLTAQGPVLFDGTVRNSGAILASDVIVQSGPFEVGPIALGAATFSINGVGVWRSGIIARQPFRVEAGASLAIDPTSGHTLRNAAMTNFGTVTQRASISLDGTSPVVNQGVWTLGSLSAGISRVIISNPSTFLNTGLLSCETPSGTPGTLVLNIPIHKEGEISASTGDLGLIDFTSEGGQLSASPGRRLSLDRDATFDGASQCSGDGTVTATIGLVRVASGTLLTALDQSGSHAGGFTLNSTPGIVIAPDARLQNAGTFTWLRGTVRGESGPGAADGAFENMGTFSARAASGTIQNLLVQNTDGGRVIVDVGTQLFLRDSDIFSRNGATVDLRSGSVLRSTQSQPDRPTALTFFDSSLIKTTLAPSRVGCHVFTSGGRVEVREGELALAQAVPPHNFVASTITTAVNAHLILENEARAAGTTFLGGGTFTLRNAAVLTVSGESSTNEMNGPGDGMVLQGGMLTGSSRFRNRGTLRVQGGSLGNPDIFDLPFQLDNAGTIAVTGTAARFAALMLNLESGLITADAPIGMAGGSTLYNEGDISLGEGASIGVLPGDPLPLLRNEGLVVKRETGATNIAVSFANSFGFVEVRQGLLTISGPIQELTPNASPPNTYNLDGGTYNVEPQGNLSFGGRLVTILSGSASVNVRGSFNDCKPSTLRDNARVEIGSRVAPSTPFVAQGRSTLNLVPGGVLGTAQGGSPDATFRESSRVTGNGFIDRDVSILEWVRMNPGFSPGEITFRSLTMVGGVLAIEIGGPTPVTEHDRITVVNQAALGGTLELSLLDGFSPPLGATFTILNAGSVTGQFAQVIQPTGLADGLKLRPQVSGSTVVVRVVQEADFNADGFVDFFDFLDYVTCFEGDPCPPGTDADFNSDGFVDFFDYLDFVTAFEGG